MLLNFVHNALAKPARMLFGTALVAALAACGGGGGSPGAVGGNPVDPTNPGVKPVASISLAVSADTMNGSGADGSEVTLTAIAKDASNNALPNVVIGFTASSGTVSSTNRTTDASGAVTEKLSVKGDPSPRAITITATSGTVSSPAKTVTVTSAVSLAPKLLLTASSGSLPSAGVAGSNVEIRALVLDVNNVVVKDVNVSFTTSSGALSASRVATDAAGVAVVRLNTADDAATRTITVTANVDGSPATTVAVNVVGTKLTLNAPSSVKLGAKVDLTAQLTNSNGSPLANRPVTFSALRGTVTSKAGAASPASTDANGNLVLTYTGTANGADTITVLALGERATADVTTVSTNFSVGVVDFTNDAYVPRVVADTDFCNTVLVRDFDGSSPRGGDVSISTSRGTLYTDAACSAPLTTVRPLAAGQAIVYLKATSPGVATLTASSSNGANTVQGAVEFTAPITANAIISVQATPAVIGANAAGSTGQQSILRAVVLDRATQGNPVKNARVAFSIVNDPSGGVLSQPSEVVTASDGSASVAYIAGSTTTGANGVVIRAQIASGASTASATAALTVSQRSLFITAGTGNQILAPNSSTYQIDYSVFVTDASGNPVPGVSFTSSVRPRTYSKGRYVYNGTLWAPVVSVTCQNEDLDSNGVLGSGEDFNGNGRLDPGISLNISPGATTGANGTSIISLIYPRDRANWIDVDFVIRGAVTGSESSYLGYTRLPVLGTDISNEAASPPGAISPYGVSSSCRDDK